MNNYLKTPGKGNVQLSSDQQSMAVVNYVFKKLKAIFPAWSNAIRTEEMEIDAKREWLTGLVESGVTTNEKLSKGFVEARKCENPFFPSCGQFIQWCQPRGRVNEAMYQINQPALPKHTRAEYQKIGMHWIKSLKEMLSKGELL